jgi:hypothetical protein
MFFLKSSGFFLSSSSWNQPVRFKINLSETNQEALEGLKKDASRDIKLDDKSGCFVVADTADYVKADTNSLDKLSSVEKVNIDDKCRLVKEIESEVGSIIFDMVSSGEITENTAE